MFWLVTSEKRHVWQNKYKENEGRAGNSRGRVISINPCAWLNNSTLQSYKWCSFLIVFHFCHCPFTLLNCKGIGCSIWAWEVNPTRSYPTSHLTCYRIEQFPKEFVVSVARFKSSSIQDNVHFVNDGPIKNKIGDKWSYALGCGYLRLTNPCLRFSVRSNQDILSSSTISSKYGHFWLQKKQDDAGHYSKVKDSKQL